MRNCSLCQAPDRPLVVEDARCNCQGGEVEGHAADCQRIEHTVQRDIRFHDGPLRKKQTAKGWRERTQGFRGRPAIERFICGPCVQKQDEIEEIQRFKKTKSDELDPDKVPTMYQILCD